MSVYLTELDPGKGKRKTRHLEPTCERLRDEVRELHPELGGQPVEMLDAAVEMTLIRNTPKMRMATDRCAVCFAEYAKDERAVATGGEARAGFPKAKDGAFHAASVLADGTARQKAAAKKLAAKKGVSLEERAQAAIARQRQASS